MLLRKKKSETEHKIEAVLIVKAKVISRVSVTQCLGFDLC